jgi:hypothetical protein
MSDRRWYCRHSHEVIDAESAFDMYKAEEEKKGGLSQLAAFRSSPSSPAPRRWASWALFR